MSAYARHITKVFFIFLLMMFACPFEVPCVEEPKGASTEKVSSLSGKRNIDPSFVMSPETLRGKMKSKEGITIVDVRNGDDFQKLRIPGSINVPLYTVKTKTFLKSGKSVLVNEGYSYSELESTCFMLRKSGFNVWVLGGGLNSWLRSGLPVEGGGLYKREVNRIAPRDFFMEQNYGHWTVINISTPIKKNMAGTLPGSVYLNKGNEDTFLKGFSRLMSGHEKDPLSLALIYSEDGEGYQKIESILKKSGIKNIFYLKGGLLEYNKYMKQRTTLLEGGKTITREENCPTCPR